MGHILSLGEISPEPEKVGFYSEFEASFKYN